MAMRTLVAIIVLTLVTVPAIAAEDGGVRIVLPPHLGRRQPMAEDVPGRMPPVAPVAPLACRVRWDVHDSDLVSVIVVEPGTGLRRPAWVATFKHATNELEVAYAGTAFRDENRQIHIDCRGAFITGPNARHWSPDSFAFGEAGNARVIDDADRGNDGETVSDLITPATGAAAIRRYRSERLLARCMAEGVL